MKYGNYEWPNVYEEAEEMIISEFNERSMYRASFLLILRKRKLSNPHR
jgi:hypothetical protein